MDFCATENGKVVLVPAMKEYRESRGIISLILISALDRFKRSTSYPGRFCPGKELRYPLNRRLGGPKIPSGRFGEDKNPFHLPEMDVRSPSPDPCQYTDSANSGHSSIWVF